MNEDIKIFGKVFCTYMVDKGVRSAYEYASELPLEIRAAVIREGGDLLLEHKEEFINAILNK